MSCEIINYEYVNKFLTNLKVERNYSENTLIDYETNLKRYIDFFCEYLNSTSTNKTIMDANNNDVRLFLASLYNLEYQSATIANFISTLKSFYNYCLEMNFIKTSPMSDIEYPKKGKALPKILYNSEIKTFFDAIKIEEKWGKRNRALFYLLYSSGIRVSECANLKINDINFKEQTIKVIGKGNKERLVPVHPKVLKYLDTYIETERTTFLKEDTNNVFINNLGKQLTDRGIRYLATKLTNEAAMTSKVTPHMFRHTLATQLLNSGMDLRYIQEILGHSKLVTTEVYTHLSIDNISRKYDKIIKR